MKAILFLVCEVYIFFKKKIKESTEDRETLTFEQWIKVPFFNKEYQLNDGFNKLFPHLYIYVFIFNLIKKSLFCQVSILIKRCDLLAFCSSGPRSAAKPPPP